MPVKENITENCTRLFLQAGRQCLAVFFFFNRVEGRGKPNLSEGVTSTKKFLNDEVSRQFRKVLQLYASKNNLDFFQIEGGIPQDFDGR